MLFNKLNHVVESGNVHPCVFEASYTMGDDLQRGVPCLYGSNGWYEIRFHKKFSPLQIKGQEHR